MTESFLFFFSFCSLILLNISKTFSVPHEYSLLTECVE